VTATRTPSIRTHIIVIVMAGSIFPLALIGFWLASSAVRAGSDLLRQHLSLAADRFVDATNARWQFRSTDLELLAHNDVTSRALSGVPITPADSQYLAGLVTDLSGWVTSVQLRRGPDHVVWSSPRDLEQAGRGQAAASSDRLIELSVPATTAPDGQAGTVVVQARLASLIAPDSGRPLVAGSRVALRQRSAGVLFATLDAAVGFPDADAVEVGGRRWFVERRFVDGPGLEFAVGAPLESYVLPFERAGRVGLGALAVVIVFALLLTTYLTTRLTRPVQRLADAADFVAGGDLDHRVMVVGPAELRRLGSSFNTMTDSLRRTLSELAERRALAAVGEFATSLSHDVRNALTSVKVDLQRAVRRPGADRDAHELVQRALNNVARLESTVTGALRVARTGQLASETVDLCEALTSAANMVQGAYASIPATLDLDLGNTPQYMRGDRVALEQLFANLLFNAGQAERAGGRVRLRLEASHHTLVVTVSDNGIGMTAAELERVCRESHSTKRNGSGLGLPIARQIAAAHGGLVRISSTLGRGTVVRVELSRGADVATSPA
jgi:signal transduction histidine kinase